MRLDLGDGTSVDNPTQQVVAAALKSLSLEDPRCEFAILEDCPGYYMQTVKNQDGSYDLEYQEGDLSKHYELSYRVIDVADLIVAFSSYLLRDNEWRKNEWRKMDVFPSEHAE